MVTNITCILTGEGWLYLAALLDLHSRHPWLVRRPHMRDKLVTEALQRARSTCSGQSLDGLIATATGLAIHLRRLWQWVLRLPRMTTSMSRTANCYNNATMESFLAALKSEAFRAIPATRQEARFLIHDFIDALYPPPHAPLPHAPVTHRLRTSHSKTPQRLSYLNSLADSCRPGGAGDHGGCMENAIPGTHTADFRSHPPTRKFMQNLQFCRIKID